MLTQIQCPNCGTPYSAEVQQVIDVGRNPELKAALLGGQLNVAVCPSCGTAGQLSSAMVYHDPEHELFMVHVPQELNLDQMQREEYVGRLTREVIDNLPPEQRRAYLFQPITMFTMQSFMEKVLETEGVTKEMIERQQKQVQLLNTLIGADKDVVDHLLKERGDEIDEVFFAMLRQYVDAAAQMNDDSQLIPLINLQAKLMTSTDVGRKIEQQQMAMHALNRDANEAGGLTPAVLLKHVVKNQEDADLVNVLGQAGIQAMTYEFFSGLTAEIEKQQEDGNNESAQRLTAIRSDLLQMREDVQNQTQELLGAASETLAQIMAAEDMKSALQAQINSIDDAFMYVLSMELARAEDENQQERAARLNELRDLIVDAIESQTPPEVRLLNQLVRAESEEARQQLIDDNQDLVSSDLVTVVEALQDQATSNDQADLNERLVEVKRLLRAELSK